MTLSLSETPGHYRLLFSQQDIQAAMKRVADEIRIWIDQTRDSGKETSLRSDIVVVPILRGALFFSADLIREIQRSVELRPMITSTYSSNAQNRSLRELGCDFFGYLPRGKRVLLIDDMCDSGITLSRVYNFCKREGAIDIKTVVLVYRPLEIHPTRLIPDFHCFTYDDTEWLVGYGLDDDEKNRHLKDIYRLKAG